MFDPDEITDLTIAIVSPEFGVTIPKEFCERLGLSPGQRFNVVLRRDRIELYPVTPMNETRGFLRGLDTEVVREEDRL